MSREDERTLSTADFVAGSDEPRAREQRDLPQLREPQPDHEQRMTQVETRSAGATSRNSGDASGAAQPEPLAELFAGDVAQAFRSRWDAVQIGFVDDPKQAVKQADELVAQVMKSLAESFSRQRSTIEGDVGGGNEASTENLRVALQRYRSFFQRLLSL
jgi:hypothetical protein